MNAMRDRLRRLPAVDTLLAQRELQELSEIHGREQVVAAARQQLAAARSAILQAQPAAADTCALITKISAQLERQARPSLRPVINATGVILHTNLGRAPLSPAAAAALQAAALGYSALEYDLEAGRRGSRLQHASAALRALTGAEDALVVNNNGAALVLILSALASGREVILSRGQLLEIGGGFRIPDIMRQSGAQLVEVGTTNRTRSADYAAAISERTALLLRVHASNFKQIGFVEEAPLAALSALAREHKLPLVDDLGSGTLIDTAPFGLAREPTIQESVAAGCDLVCFSGDKLLGGPQAGIIIGKAPLIARLKRHPLTRALRVDKLTYAALLATLRHYQRGEALMQLPVWRMISRPLPEIQAQAQAWAQLLGGEVRSGKSTVGGGSLPGTSLPTALLAFEAGSAQALAARLRQAEPPVIARIADDALLLDPRTVLPEQAPDLLRALKAALAAG